VPPLYEFRVRSRIFKCYGQLLDELNQLESRAEKITVPLSYTDELYALRNNIQLVRKKLQRL
ncbi:MAG: TAXI family TRAP transporter solute-binding subunit, partial [Polaromonas sp.]